MRLIDADKLVNDIAEHITVKAVSRVLAITQGQPTIDAIPVEWIEQWLLKNCYDENGHYNGEGYDTVGDMMEDWRKENG